MQWVRCYPIRPVVLYTIAHHSKPRHWFLATPAGSIQTKVKTWSTVLLLASENLTCWNVIGDHKKVTSTSFGICIHYDLWFAHECSDTILEKLNFYSVSKTIFLNMSSIWHYTILSLDCVLHILFTKFGLHVFFQKVNIKSCGYIIFCCLPY